MNLVISGDAAPDELEICELYWSMDGGSYNFKVSEIAETFAMKSRDVGLKVKELSYLESLDVFCTECDTPKTFRTRSSITKPYYYEEYTCTECKALEEKANELIRHASKQSKAEKIHKMLSDSLSSAFEDSPSIDSLNLRQVVFLLSLMNIYSSEDYSVINPVLKANIHRLTPSHEFDLSLVRELYQSGVINIHPESSPEYFSLNNEGGYTFSIDKVFWVVTCGERIPVSELITKLISIVETTSLDAELYELAKNINEQEVYSYLYLCMEQRGFEFNAGAKTKQVVNKALDMFSVSQCYSMIWSCAKSASDYYVKENISKKHAANSMITSLSRYLEKAVLNGWDVSSYKRNYNYPQSEVSRVIFGLACKTDDGGFNALLSNLIPLKNTEASENK